MLRCNRAGKVTSGSEPTAFANAYGCGCKALAGVTIMIYRSPVFQAGGSLAIDEELPQAA